MEESITSNGGADYEMGYAMKFGRVPEIAKKARPWATVKQIGSPEGMEGPIGVLDEVQVENWKEGYPGVKVFRVFVELEDGDIERLKAGNPLEFGILGYQMQPIMLSLWPNGGEDND